MKTYKNLLVWQKAMLHVNEVYLLTKNYPKEEMFSLASQTKRAAISVPANIAEGVGRNYKKDTIQFLHISRGSLYELETLLIIAFTNVMIQQYEFDKMGGLIEEILKMLNGLISSYEKREDLK